MSSARGERTAGSRSGRYRAGMNSLPALPFGARFQTNPSQPHLRERKHGVVATRGPTRPFHTVEGASNLIGIYCSLRLISTGLPRLVSERKSPVSPTSRGARTVEGQVAQHEGPSGPGKKPQPNMTRCARFAVVSAPADDPRPKMTEGWVKGIPEEREETGRAPRRSHRGPSAWSSNRGLQPTSKPPNTWFGLSQYLTQSRILIRRRREKRDCPSHHAPRRQYPAPL
jgi:hypothetical protein